MLSEALTNLTHQIDKLSAKLTDATAAHHLKKLPPSPVITYHLLALISGRAWLGASNGGSNSVTIGTPIKHYGYVTAIEVRQGKVLTSSGKVITYNPDWN